MLCDTAISQMCSSNTKPQYIYLPSEVNALNTQKALWIDQTGKTTN